MNNTITGGSAMQRPDPIYSTAEISMSKLTAILDRVRHSISVTDAVRQVVGMQADRLLGCASVGNGPKLPPTAPANTGVVGELDDLISDLINQLEYLNEQAQRLASV